MELKFDDLRDEQKMIAEAIGMESYLALARKFGGTSIYIAKAEEIQRRMDRDKKIREEFNGNNYSQLAMKYGLTEVWIRNIVLEKAMEIKRKPLEGQLDLKDFL